MYATGAGAERLDCRFGGDVRDCRRKTVLPVVAAGRTGNRVFAAANFRSERRGHVVGGPLVGDLGVWYSFGSAARAAK